MPLWGYTAFSRYIMTDPLIFCKLRLDCEVTPHSTAARWLSEAAARPNIEGVHYFLTRPNIETTVCTSFSDSMWGVSNWVKNSFTIVFFDKVCRFAWYLLHFGMFTFHFARYLLNFDFWHFNLTFCMVFCYMLEVQTFMWVSLGFFRVSFRIPLGFLLGSFRVQLGCH